MTYNNGTDTLKKFVAYLNAALEHRRAAYCARKAKRGTYERSLDKAKTDDVLFRFPTIEEDKDTCLILKRPKNDSSIRELLVSDPLKAEVEARVAEVKRNRKALGERYHEYGLLLCLENGNPIEPNLMMRWFREWQKKRSEESNECYPKLVFHGIRHSSATYYVENCEGDFKSVQAITGHNSLEVLLKIYAHATTPARQRLINTFQTKFYGGQPVDNLTSTFTAPRGREGETVSTLVTLAKESPEIKNLLLTICKENPSLQETILTALLAG